MNKKNSRRNRKKNRRNIINGNTDVQYIRKDCVNVLYVNCGNMARGKASEYMKHFIESVKPTMEGYKVIYMAKFDD